MVAHRDNHAGLLKKLTYWTIEYVPNCYEKEKKNSGQPYCPRLYAVCIVVRKRQRTHAFEKVQILDICPAGDKWILQTIV